MGMLLFSRTPVADAGVAQLVEHFLAKEDVASSSLVTRSISDDSCVGTLVAIQGTGISSQR
jgi:hypothetical protein